MSPKPWANCPLPVIPKDDRVKSQEIGICKVCNLSKRIGNSTYNLCSPCSYKYRYYGASCDVPNCESVADGLIGFNVKENKMVCQNCSNVWKRLNFCIWERLVDKRHLTLLRPKTFINALAEGLVSPVENPVKQGVIAECNNCKKEQPIKNGTYQLCIPCLRKLQYYGEKCSIGGAEPCPNGATGFDTHESRFVCKQCSEAKRKYTLTYEDYETQIRTKTNCMICAVSISHNRAEGKRQCSAYIDHDHNTGKFRGVLCNHCNDAEGSIDKMQIDPLTYAKNLVSYLEAHLSIETNEV